MPETASTAGSPAAHWQGIPLLATKLHVPAPRPTLVVRQRLLTALDEGLHNRLVLLSAPAGFGKTTLVAAGAPRAGMPVAWLSLDKNDNQIGRFLSYLVATLQQADHTVGNEAAQLLVASEQTSPDTILTSLINDLDIANRDMVLVLDDYQSISSPEVHEAVAFLLEHCPHTFHLVIATRSDPPLPLARLRARGLTVELRSADLGFTEPEAAQFLNEAMGLHLDAGSVAALEARTEGWIAGLQMAALSMRGREDVTGFIEGFSGTNRYILDYLLEEVLANQSPEVQRFLLCTSILERLTAPLCDALLKNEGGRMKDEAGQPSTILHPSSFILDYLERANLFLVPLDDERNWYRYHQLFSDLLRARLQQTQHELLPVLHARAVDWCEGHGLATEAVDHALAGKDWSRAARLIEQQAMSSMTGESVTTLISWLETMPDEHLHGRPWLGVYRAWSLILGCQPRGVEELLQHAEQHLQGPDGSMGNRDVLGNIAMIRAYLALFAGDTEGVAEQVSLADELLPDSDRVIRSDVQWVLGFPPYLRGDLVSAVEAWHKARKYSIDVGNPHIAVAAIRHLAHIDCIRGRLRAAVELYQEALGLAAERGWQHSRLTSAVKKDLADVYRERNEFPMAPTLAYEAVDECERYGSPSNLAMAQGTLAHVLCAQGKWDDACHALDKAMQLCRSHATYPGVRSRVESCQVRFWLKVGDLSSALRWVDDNHLYPDDVPAFRLEQDHITLAHVLLAQDQCGKAAALLARLDDAAKAGGRVGSRIEILALLAQALQSCGDTRAALSAVSEALALAEPEGYVRVFLDKGQPAQMLLARWLARASAGSLRDYAIRLLSRFDAEPHAVTVAKDKASSAGDLVEPLSQRELEVLHLMALGTTNQGIAEQLIVAAGTVKAHTSSIYRKLDVANRTEAVARARQLGILP